MKTPAREAPLAGAIANTVNVVAEPPLREAMPAGVVVPLDPPTREEIEQEVQGLMAMAPNGSFDVDVVVIGSGPGGYVASIRAAQLGGRVVCIEKDGAEWGGTCLNWGCIPTKTMIASVERYQLARSAGRLGVTVGEVGYDFGKIMERKDKVVGTLRGGVETLLKSNHVRKVIGTGRITGPNRVEVTAPDGGKETITTKNIIIATGSTPIMPPIPGLERKASDARGASSNGIWTSDEAVRTAAVPKTMLIIGGGVVGVEFSYVFNGLGTQVTVVELMEEIIPAADAEISAELRKALTRQGVKFLLGSKVTQVASKKGGHTVTVEGPKGAQTIECEVILVGVGRRALLSEVGLESVKVETERRGIVCNERMQTSVPNIYAIGDVVAGGYALAHVASHQGVVAAENCLGHEAKMDYRAVPSPIFTEPEMATTGLSEKQAREAGYDVVVGKFPFRPLGKAMAMDQQEGMVKIVSERKYGEVLGVHIVGPHASDLIHEGVAAIKLEATVDELATMIHAHPTLAQAILEAAEDVKGQAIHKVRA